MELSVYKHHLSLSQYLAGILQRQLLQAQTGILASFIIMSLGSSLASSLGMLHMLSVAFCWHCHIASTERRIGLIQYLAFDRKREDQHNNIMVAVP